jgi:predicted ATPase
VIVVSHAPALVDALQQVAECHSIVLDKHFGETRVAGDDPERPLWQWPAR